jgi:hypothetical protein
VGCVEGGWEEEEGSKDGRLTVVQGVAFNPSSSACQHVRTPAPAVATC